MHSKLKVCLALDVKDNRAKILWLYGPSLPHIIVEGYPARPATGSAQADQGWRREDEANAQLNSPVFSPRRLDPSRALPSSISATNSETVGSQSHSLRQSVCDEQPNCA